MNVNISSENCIYLKVRRGSFEGVVCFMLASSWLIRGFCCSCFKPKTVGAYRIRPSRWRKSRLNGGDVFVVSMSDPPVQSSCHP